MKVKKLPLHRSGQRKVFQGRVAKHRGHQNKHTRPRWSSAGTESSPRQSSTSNHSLRKCKLCRRDFSDIVEVGRGGFGIVYRALTRDHKVPCVLKSIQHARILKMNAKIQDIETERSLFQSLDHVNIPKFLGFYGTNTTSVFVLEYCDGGDLYDYIFRRSKGQSFPRTASRNLAYIRQLVTAVDYFQRSTKHIHMDIKPENILLTSQDVIKLTDFGCSLSMELQRQVHKKDNGGTTQYQPPEMLRRKRRFDSTVDVWGIGCVVFQLMAPSGEHPYFPRDSDTNQLRKDVRTAMLLMADFKKGICQVEDFKKMDEVYKTFLRQTIGAERLQRPLVSKLLDTALLTNMARVYSPCL